MMTFIYDSSLSDVKNCFNFKKLQEAQEAAIAQLLQQGFALYSKAFGLA